MPRAFPILLFILPLIACTEEAEEVELRSLQSSTEMSFVCMDQLRQGLPRGECPDVDNVPVLKNLTALVTQTATDEVAVIDTWYATVRDVDSSVPGFSFLRLPSRPGDIVTTPGGVASFVGLTGVGKTGISALPTSCLGPPVGDQSARDVTTFPACTLPSAPGDMVVLVEPPSPDGVREGCDPASPLEIESPLPPGAFEYEVVCRGETVPIRVDPIEQTRYLCADYVCPAIGEGADELPPEPPSACRRVRDCTADLTSEAGPVGRRKLAVAIPDEGRIVVIDAQRLIDREPGTFQPCEIEASIPLLSEVDAAGQEQADPEGLHPEGCMLSRPQAPPNPPSFVTQPAGMALTDGRLYVADLGVPLVHVLDASSACGLAELSPLLPMSFDDPMRDVVTSRVAVTPLTPSGKRFVYAVDPDDRPTASLMAFDVSPSSTDRTPIVRRGALRAPAEQPDRIQFAAPIVDVVFGLRDLPEEDPNTGVAEAGLYCDPDPATPASEPEALYRPSGDYTQGARPELLRGLFGFAMLTSGQVVVIDVDDFDAPCRRPRYTNAESTQDFRGCADDPYFASVPDEEYDPNAEVLATDGRATVTDEVSCNVVEPHWSRAAVLGAVTSSAGQGAPSLRAFPQFVSPDRSTQPAPADLPKLLAVNYPSPRADEPEGVPPEVYVGTTFYRGSGGRLESSAAELVTDPNVAEQATLSLPFNHTRSYAPSDPTEVTYEGAITNAYPNGFLDFSASDPSNLDGVRGLMVDTSAVYCDHGVYDEAMMKELGSAVLGLPADDPEEQDEDIDRFARAHADYVQIIDDFPDAYDPYWVELGDRDPACGGGGRKGCLEIFGSSTAQSLGPERELRVIDAYQDHLVVAPRLSDLEGAPEEEQLEQAGIRTAALACCFPSGTAYVVRASNQWVMRTSAAGFRHDVVGRAGPDPDGAGPLGSFRCERDCDPRKSFNQSRAFEITSKVACQEPVAGQPDETRIRCSVGAQQSSWMDPCAYDPGDRDSEEGTRGVPLTDEDAARCIVENLTSRFAVYRGVEPSIRDMKFRWETVGGFFPLTVSMTARSAAVLPQRIEYVSELQSLFITDAATLGLSLATLDSLSIDDPWPVF
jgi:hypothetical protein